MALVDIYELDKHIVYITIAFYISILDLIMHLVILVYKMGQFF